MNTKYKGLILLFYLGFLSSVSLAQTTGYGEVLELKHWVIEGMEEIDASFFMLKKGEVYLEDVNGKVITYPLKTFSGENLYYIIHMSKVIRDTNQSPTKEYGEIRKNRGSFQLTLIIIMIGGVFGFVIWMSLTRKKKKRVTYNL